MKDQERTREQLVSELGELRQRIAELEAIEDERKLAEKALHDNEERYRALSNASFEAIFISENGICIDTNQTATEMFGYDYDELIGVFGTDVIAPESKELVGHFMLSGYEEPYEAIAQRKDGTTFQVEIRGKMTEYKGRSVRVTVVHDIDKSKKMEERLRQSEEKYREIFELSPEAIVLLDRKGNILDVNARSYDWLGYRPEEVVGKSFLDLPFLSKEGKSKAMAKLSQRMAGKKVSPYELGFYTKSGEKRVGRIVANPIQDKNGEVIQDLVMISDITERKQAEQALRERETELKVRSRDLEEVNAALKVLLKRREEDKIELAESVQSNVKELVLPYLEKLKKSKLEPHQMTLIGILELHCKDVVSPFINKLSSKFIKLTPTEIKLADLIKAGRTTKEAAELLGLSENTIQVHRHHIRSKLGLKHAKINLRSYLRSLD
jgi:PAS domain S-box-containing protein